MDWELDSVLISHMGEGNWKIARKDRPVRLIDRPLGIGRLDNPPTPVFSAEPGPATTRCAGPARGRVLPARRRPRRGARHARAAEGRDALLPLPPRAGDGAVHGRLARLGAPHHFVTNLGDHARALAPVRRAARPRVRGDLSSCRPASVGASGAARDGPGREPGAARPRAGDADLGQRQRDRSRARGSSRSSRAASPTRTMTRRGHRRRRPRRQRRSRASGARRPTRRRTWRCTARSSRSAGSCTRTRRGRRRGRRRSARSRCSGRRTPTCARIRSR